MKTLCLILCLLLSLPVQSLAETANSEPITRVQLGTWTSVVEYQGQVIAIPTIDLVAGSDVPTEQRLATILAPSNGKCTMRELALEDSRPLQTVMAGTIVVVLAPGDGWTLVWVNGQGGYVRTECLQFHAPVTEIVGHAVVVRDGRTDGKQTVTLHHIPSSYAPKLVSWPTGTQVTVLAAENGWCEVEANGVRGFIRERHLMMLDEE